MNEIPFGDTKPDRPPDCHPTRHLVIGNPRIKSEPVLVGAIAWLICWKLRQTALPLLPKYKLIGPAPAGGSDHGLETGTVGDLKGTLSPGPDVGVEST